MLIPTTVLTQTTAAFVGVRAVRSTSQTIAASTLTAVQLNATDDYDTDAFHDTVTNNNRITIPAGKSGYYSLKGQLAFANATTGHRQAFITVGAGLAVVAVVLVHPIQTGLGTTFGLTGDYFIAAGDYAELYAYQSTAGNLSLDSAWFSAAFLGT